MPPPPHTHTTHLQALGILLARMHSHHPERHQQFGFGLGNFFPLFFKKKPLRTIPRGISSLALDRQFFSSFFFKKNTAQHHPEKHQQFGFRLNHFLSLAEIFSSLG
jgi:hypothetical protein